MSEDEPDDEPEVRTPPVEAAARPGAPAGAADRALAAVPPADRERMRAYLAAARDGIDVEEIPRGLVQWQEGTDMRTALTGRWQTFQLAFLEKGQERLDDDETMEWFEEQLDWWLVEADSASAGSGHTKAFEIIRGWVDYQTQARRLGMDEVESKYGYVSLVNNRLGIGWHVEPPKNVKEALRLPRELLKSLHYADVARQIEDYVEEHGDQLTLVDVAAMMADQARNQDRDVVAVFDASDDNQQGSVGLGKSSGVLQLAPLVDPTFDLRFDLAYSVDAVRFDRLMRVAMAKKLSKGKVWGHDEVENVLYKRESMHGKNKNRVKRFLRVRKRNQVILLAANSIWNLDEVMREDRVTWRIRIPERGWCEVYRTAGRKFVDEQEDAWGVLVTESPLADVKAERPDVWDLYQACVDLIDTAASKLEEEGEGGDDLSDSPLDELLKKNPRWGLNKLREDYRGLVTLRSEPPGEVTGGG